MTFPKSKRRYVVFVSSTRKDLEAERLAAQQAVLMTGNIPVTMENFPASSRGPEAVIKQFLSDADYCILISAGKYGSVPSGGVKSYTEIEYDISLKNGIPVIPFLRQDLETLSPTLRDSGDDLKKLEMFQSRLRQHTVREYSSVEQLKANILASVPYEIDLNPRPGLYRGADLVHPEMIGAWEYVDPSGSLQTRKVKVFTQNEFVVVWYRTADDWVEVCHGGTYSLTGDEYQQCTLFAGDRTRGYRGQSVAGTVELTGSIMRSRLCNSQGEQFDETWRKIEAFEAGPSYSMSTTTQPY